MRLDIFNGFVTKEEADSLNTFVLEAIKAGKFTEGFSSKHLNPDGVHVVSRFNRQLVLPELAFTIKHRIMEALDLTINDTCTKFASHGVVINCSFKHGQLVAHKDARQFEDKALLRCNIVTSQPNKGGELHVNNDFINLKDMDMYTCLVSEYEHYATINEDDKPRIVWQFGFNVDKSVWEKG